MKRAGGEGSSPPVFLPIGMPRSIGTQRESSLHRQLKSAYAGPAGLTEVESAGFIADVASADGGYVEVQTGNFGALKKKARGLAALGRLKIVYPVIVAKYLDVFDSGGEKLYRRKSGRAGKIWDLFRELIYAPELPFVPNLEIELALVDVAEERVMDGKGSWRRKGASVRDRKLLDLREQICLKTPADYLRFVPFARNEEFTAEDLRQKAKIHLGLARKSLYALARLGIVERAGKRGRAYLYRLRVSARKKKWEKPS